jgi:competence protein ComEA
MRDPTASWYVIEEAGPDGSVDPARAAPDRGPDPGPGGRSGTPEGQGGPGPLGAIGALGGGPAVVRLVLAAAAGAVVAAALVLSVGGAGGPAVAVDAVGSGTSTSAPTDRSPAPGTAAAEGDGPPGAAGGAGAPDLVVDVEGAVLHPGVVRLPSGARVGEAIAAAGGYSPSVDVDRAPLVINLAAPVTDGDRIRVPAVGDAEEAAALPGQAVPTAAVGDGSESPGAAASAPIDLNRATQAELEALPGIGPVTARKIIEARKSAPFVSVQDLRDRKLVGAATYAKIAPLVTAGP